MFQRALLARHPLHFAGRPVAAVSRACVGPGSQVPQRWSLSLSGAGLLRFSIWCISLYNCRFGPWQKGGWSSKIKDAAEAKLKISRVCQTENLRSLVVRPLCQTSEHAFPPRTTLPPFPKSRLLLNPHLQSADVLRQEIQVVWSSRSDSCCGASPLVLRPVLKPHHVSAHMVVAVMASAPYRTVRLLSKALPQSQPHHRPCHVNPICFVLPAFAAVWPWAEPVSSWFRTDPDTAKSGSRPGMEHLRNPPKICRVRTSARPASKTSIPPCRSTFRFSST